MTAGNGHDPTPQRPLRNIHTLPRVGVRGLARAIVAGAQQAGTRGEFVATPEEAGAWLARETRDGDVVLLKASRGVKLEKALETWRQKIGIPSAPGAGN